MSYILEALKKAQAERQLGSAPTIHAPVVHLQAASSANRKPLVIGFAAGALLVVGALVAWRQHAPSAPAQTVATAQQSRSDSPAAGEGAVQASAAVTQAGAADGAAATGQRNASALAAAAQAPAPRARVALVPDEATHAPAAVSGPAVAGPGNAQALGTSGVAAQAVPAARAGAPVQGGPQPQGLAQRPPAAALVQGGAQPQAMAQRQPAAAPAPVAAPAVVPSPAQPASVVATSAQPPAAAQAAGAAGSDAALPTLNALPDAVRGSVPKIAFGGYMYSANPADRLILVDNILRHEGEEVAPGLMLEKLLPKGAVMNFRGYRYRVAF